MKDTYESPLASRYASREMLYIFSPDKKFTTWRRLWIALARAEKELGLPITQGQIDELEREKDHINYDLAQEKERELRHDVMAHIHAYGAQCPSAMPILHLGSTSCYVGDNIDIILMKGLPASTRPCPPWAIPTIRPPSWSPWASGPPCGCMSSSRTWRSWSPRDS